MKSIKQQYIDLREGRMTQQNFMRNLRMTMPQYITNVTSYNDSIKILKNKGILVESDLREKNLDIDQEELKKGIAVEKEHTSDLVKAEEIALDHLKEDPKYYTKLKKAGLEENEESGEKPINKMTREDMIDFLGIKEKEAEGMSDKDLRDAVIDKNDDLKENQEELSPRMKHIQKSMGDMTKPPITPERAKELKAKLDAERERRKKSGLQEVKVTIYGTDKAMKMLKSELKNNNVVFETDGNKVNVEDSPKVKMAVKMVKERVGMQSIKLSESVRLKEAKDEKGKWTNTSGKSMYDQFKEIDNLNAQEVLIGIDAEMEKNHELTKLAAAKIVLKNIKKNSIYYTSEYMSGKEGYEPEYISKSTKPETQHMTPVKGENFVDKANAMQKVKNVEKAKASANKASKETNTVVKGVEELTLIAKTVRGVQKFDATGEKMKTIRESVDKALAKERLKEIIRQELAEIFDGRDNMTDVAGHQLDEK